MGTWNAFYVRALPEKVVPTIRKDFPKAEVEQFEEFSGVRMGDDEFRPPEELLVKLSSELSTDVMWLSLQSAVDAFQFHRWKSGEHIRSLVYGCFEAEGTWERVEGKAELWEREAFFGAKALKIELDYAKNEERKEELRKIWKDGGIVIGGTVPMISASSSAHEVAKHYRLPHFGIE